MSNNIQFKGNLNSWITEPVLGKYETTLSQESKNAWPGFRESLARIQRKLGQDSEKAINKRKLCGNQRKLGQDSEKAWPGFRESLARIQRKP